jgi:hypothetical protein
VALRAGVLPAFQQKMRRMAYLATPDRVDGGPPRKTLAEMCATA